MKFQQDIARWSESVRVGQFSKIHLIRDGVVRAVISWVEFEDGARTYYYARASGLRFEPSPDLAELKAKVAQALESKRDPD